MSLTKIVAIGDVHLCSGHPRNQARLDGLDQAIAFGLSLGPDLGAWLVLGDLFDTTSTPEDRNALARRFLVMAGRAPVIVPRGNHDPIGDLLIFASLDTPYPIIVRESSDVVRVQLANELDATMSLVPWPSAASFVARGVPQADIPAAAREALDAIFMDHGAKLAAARANGDLTLFAGHATAVGSIASSGQPQGDQGVVIDAAMLARLGDCPKLLGHIHAPQEIAGAIYAGSVSRNDFGEREDKRFLVLTHGPVCDICGHPAACFGAYEDPEAEPRYACDRCCGHGNEDGWCKPISEGGITDCPPRWFIESRPINCAEMVLLDAEFVDGTLVFDVEPPANLGLCEVRLRVRFKQSEKAFYEAAAAGLLAPYRNAAAKCVVEPICIPDRAVRAPAVVAAKTSREKVQAWAAVTKADITDDVMAALDRLESTPSETLLAEVQAEVEAIVTPREATVAA